MVALISLDAAPIKLTRVCGLKAVPRTTHDRAVTVVTAAFPTVGLEAGAGEREEREEKNEGRVTEGRGEGVLLLLGWSRCMGTHVTER